MRTVALALLCALALTACGGDESDTAASGNSGSSGSGGSGGSGGTAGNGGSSGSNTAGSNQGGSSNAGSGGVGATGGAGASGAGGTAGSAGSGATAGSAGTAGTGGSGGTGATAGTAGAAGTGATGGTGATAGTAGTGGSGATAGTAGVGGTGGTGGSMGDPVYDPNMDGPYQTQLFEDTFDSSTGDSVAVHCVYPISGPSSGPFPIVIVAHGFQLPASQYYSYVERLASFGYVALTVDFPTSLFSPSNPDNAHQLIEGIDWATTNLANVADGNNVGVTGHSLGGKLSLLAATYDARVKASIVLDPVDGGGGPGGGCNPPDCVDVSALMPGLQIPTGFLGETTDASGGFQPCAPAAENFTTFYAGTNSPSLSVTVAGANHMSFLDDVASCGFTCNFCNTAMASNATVNAMSRAYVTAFYERYLKGNAGYDTYLTGADAQARYVATGQATIASK